MHLIVESTDFSQNHYSPRPLFCFVLACQAALPPLRDVLAALTAASSHEGYCCEGVELVGDTVLGYLAAVHLFNTLKCVAFCPGGVLLCSQADLAVLGAYVID